MSQPPTLQFQQKLGLMFVVVIGITTLVFTVYNLRKSIFQPFVRQQTAAVFKTQDEQEQERVTLLKQKDTDGDGLTDYDELYIYRTSPFLADSDSDGIADGVEVAQGTDPNCPKDKTCREPRSTASQSAATNSSDLSAAAPAADSTAAAPDSASAAAAGSQTAGTQDAAANARVVKVLTETFGDLQELTPEKVSAKLQQMSTSDLRSFYVKLGLPEEAIAKADDATLRQVFLETLRGMGLDTSSTPAAGSAGGTSAAPK